MGGGHRRASLDGWVAAAAAAAGDRPTLCGSRTPIGQSLPPPRPLTCGDEGWGALGAAVAERR